MFRTASLFRPLLLAALLLPALAATAQTGSVGIGTTTPDPAAALDVRAANRGLLPPRLSQAQRDAVRTTGGQALGTGQAGLLIYNLTTSALNLWDGQRWQEVLGTGPGGSPAQAVAPAPVTFGYTGGPQTYTVPPGVTQVQVVADGAGSGWFVDLNNNVSLGQYRRGARVTATLAVLPGEVLTVAVGGGVPAVAAGNYNGGGPGKGSFVAPPLVLAGMAGGGATDLRRASALGSTGDYLGSRNALLVAGGAGGSTTNPGGLGGTPNGGDGASGSVGGGLGATQAGPGAGQGGGASGNGPNGGNGLIPLTSDLTGGGGGGYYGGGGGGSPNVNGNINGSAGGGGSSWATPGATNVSYALAPVQELAQLTITPLAAGPAPAFSTANLGGWQPVPAGLAYAAGSVGIGTSAPLRPLDVNGPVLLRKRLVLAPQNGDDPATNGIWNLDNAGNDLRIFQENNLGGAGGVVRLTIRNGGNVGIGTSTPGVPLDVQATSSLNLSSGYAYLANGLGAGFGSAAAANVSIRASGRVVAPEFNATSDRRLKTVIGLSDRTADLALLNQLRITDYTMKDRVQFGERKFKKVIAQEVEQVFPQAVNRQTGFLPDLYQPAAGLAALPGDSLLRLTLARPLPAAARVGQRLKLLGPQGEVLAALARAAPAGAPALTLRRPAGNALAGGAAGLFVYGLEYADVRTVDYEALAMLNVSATQELARQLTQARTEAAGAKAEATHATREAAAAHAATAELLRRVQALESQAPQARR